jgi:hypothetical protein
MTGDPGPREVERMMEELAYEHLIEIIDFDRLWQLELVVTDKLIELHAKGQLGHVREVDIPDRAAEMLERAWSRAIDDPRRWASAGWEADDNCELCRALGKQPSGVAS